MPFHNTSKNKNNLYPKISYSQMIALSLNWWRRKLKHWVFQLWTEGTWGQTKRRRCCS